MQSNLAYKFYLIYPHMLLKMINIIFISQMKTQLVTGKVRRD